ncbi:hypothetical protein ACLMJK_006850 [Lecanora helva]
MNDVSPTGSNDNLISRPSAPGSAHNDAASPPLATAADASPSLQDQKKVQRDQKAVMLEHLIRNIDIAIYAQLSILYYMDCSLNLFLLRAIPHWFYFTPKPSFFPPPPVTHRPYIGIIFGTNILALLLHPLLTPPVAGEAARGYQHGGLLIDFVGQKGPVSKWQMMGLDLLILALQVLVLGVILEKRGIKEDGGHEGEMVEEQRQDYDAEERGVLRQGNAEQEEYEMRDLNPSSRRMRSDEDRERDELLQSSGDAGPQNQQPLDSYYTGDHVIANLHLAQMIKSQWQTRSTSSQSAGASTSGVQAAVVAAAAGRTLTYRLGEGVQGNA